MKKKPEKMFPVGKYSIAFNAKGVPRKDLKPLLMKKLTKKINNYY